MEILHLYSGNLYGGIERVLATQAAAAGLCPALRPHFGLCFEGRLSGELRALHASLFMLGPARMSRPWTVFRSRRKLASLLSFKRFDVVVSHSVWPHVLFAPVVRSLGLPLIFWAHDVVSKTHWLECLARRTLPDLVVANSQFTRNHISALFPTVLAEVQYYPVMEIENSVSARKEVRTAMGTSQDAVVLVMASRLEKWKGHSLLLKALSRLGDIPCWECWIVGGAQRPEEKVFRTELERAVFELGLKGRVRFLGQRSDVSRLFAAADIHCQPNTAPEPFGVAFVEALYAGLPVVTTAMGGVLEIIDATCGVMVAPGEVDALAAALKELILSPDMRATLGRAAPTRARGLCSPEKSLTRLHRLLAPLSKSQRGAAA